MKPREPWEDWEQQLHQELMDLPELEAPGTLIPGVLSRLNQPAPVAWHQRSWWEWPLSLRLGSAIMVSVVLGVLGWLSGSFADFGLGARVVGGWQQMAQTTALLTDMAERVLGSHAAFWRQHGQTLLMISALLCLATYLTCVAAGTALYRLAWRRIS
jgi:hypothetical protein